MDAPDDVRGQSPVVGGIAYRKPLIERGVAPRHRATVVEISSNQVAKAPSIAEVPGKLAEHRRRVGLTARSIGFARGCRRMHNSVHDRRDSRVRSFARVPCTAGRAWRRRVKPWAVVMTVAIELVLPGMALAADPRFPDWPCNQVKVPEISVAAVWAGPAVDDVGNAWEEDPALKDLVARLAARRTPLLDAQKAISAVITGTESERQKRQNCYLLDCSRASTM